MRTVNIQHGVS